MLAVGEISIGIHIPADFERRLARGQRPLAQLLVNDSDSIVLSAARGLSNYAAVPVDSRSTPEGTFAIRALYNPERRSAVFIVPGLCGVILTLTMVLLTAIAIVREKERGNLELLITTPIRPIELMLGKIAPYVLIGYIQISLILLLGFWVFDVPIRGSMLDLYARAGVFVLATLVLGLFLSAITHTQFQAF